MNMRTSKCKMNISATVKNISAFQIRKSRKDEFKRQLSVIKMSFNLKDIKRRI